MKKTIKKLSLKSETIKQLDHIQLRNVVGGLTGLNCTGDCTIVSCNCSGGTACLCTITGGPTCPQSTSPYCGNYTQGYPCGPYSTGCGNG